MSRCILLVVALVACADPGAAPPVACVPLAGEAATQIHLDPQAAGGCHWTVSPGAQDTAALTQVLAQAQPGQVVCLAAGRFTLDRALRVDTPFLTLRGAGDLTVLTAGLVVRADNLTLERLSIQAAGQGVDAASVQNLVARDLTVRAASGNALHVEDCDGVLAGNLQVTAAAGAGIQVTRSAHAQVRQVAVTDSAAGVVVEDGAQVVVHDTQLSGNAVGILVVQTDSDLGGGPVIVRNNLLDDNNAPNQAPEGSRLWGLPSGLGIVVLAADATRVRHNEVRAHAAAGIVATSWPAKLPGAPADAALEGLALHDNVLEDNGVQSAPLAQWLGVPPPDAPLQVAYGACGDVPADNCIAADHAVGLDICGADTVTPPSADCAQVERTTPSYCSALGCGVPPTVTPRPPCGAP